MSRILNSFKYLSIHYQILPQICYISNFRNHKTDEIILYQCELPDTGMEINHYIRCMSKEMWQLFVVLL